MRHGITHNIKDVERSLNDVARRQIPFATSLAINEVLGDIQKNWAKRLRRVLDRPTPFTMRAFAVRRSSKRKLRGTIFVKDIQADYLRWLEDGGNRGPKKQAILVPVGQRLNKYGNMPKGAVKRALANPKVFSGTPKGGSRRGGIYRRQGNNKKLKLLVHYADHARYAPNLKLIIGAAKTANARLPGALLKAIRKAMASGR